MTTHWTLDFNETPSHFESQLALDSVLPEDALRAFYDPELVRKWWAGAHLTFEPVLGGAYVAEFEALGQTMRGVVRDFDPESALRFTWVWEHEQEAKEFDVSISAVPQGRGSLVTLRHGTYASGDEEARTGHKEGWEYFLPRLADVITK